MKGGKQLGQTVQQSRISIERRANMLGQHLTNQGFEKVRVKGKITIECVDDEGAKGMQTIEVNFSDFVRGAGPLEIGGDGRVSLGDKADGAFFLLNIAFSGEPVHESSQLSACKEFFRKGRRKLEHG